MILGGVNILNNADFSSGLASWQYTDGFVNDASCVSFDIENACLPLIELNSVTQTPTSTSTVISDTSIITTWIYDLLFDSEGCFTISFTDCLGNEFESQTVQVLPLNHCRKDLLRLDWSNTCNFAQIPYSSNDISYHLYLVGGITKVGLDKRAREQMYTSNGMSTTIYNHTIGRYELRLGAYTEAIHDILERSVEHSTFLINGEKYVLDDNSTYDLNAIGNGLYTARITLIKDGTSVVSGGCC